MKKRALSLVLAVFMLLSLMPMSAMADGATSGSYTDRYGITYTLQNAVLTVSGEGECGDTWKDYFNSTAVAKIVIEGGVTSIGSYAFRDCSSLASVVISDAVTVIGNYSFQDCNSLASVTIGSSVMSIGDNAFSDCSSLTSIAIPDSVISIGDGAFSYCGLTNVAIPDKVIIIGSYAFQGCSSLTRVSIPEGVTSIGYGAFRYCSSLTSVTIPDSVTSIDGDTFRSCSSLTKVNIGSGVTSIGDTAFVSCSSLTSVNIPDSVVSIGDSAFSDCSSLTSVSIPDSVAKIDDSAFRYCTSLAKVTIGNSVTNIGNYAFSECSALASIVIPDSVTKIGNHAFDDCSSLKNATIGSGVTSIGEYAFYNCTTLGSVTIPNGVMKISDGTFAWCSALTSVSIPDSVVSIGGSAFRSCGALTSISIPNGVTDIGESTFAYCGSLMDVQIPDSVTCIGGSAFIGCSSLTSISVPDSVTSISGYAFSDCDALISITIPSSVTSIGYRAFEGCGSLADVYYGGNAEEWAALSSQTYLAIIERARIHYNYVEGEHYAEVVTAPTCTEQGYTTHTCSCGYSYVDTYVDALGHDTELKNVKSATCTEAGYTGDEVCTRCGVTVKAGAEIAATGHSYTDVVTAPTCTDKGYTTHTCACGDSYIDSYVDALGHDTELKNVKSATCTEAGYTGDEVCKTCGETVKAGSEIAATGHDTELKNAKSATCTEAGYTGDEVCKTCGTTVKAGTAIAALGHDYKDGVCTVCGAKDSGYVPPHTHSYTDKVTAPTCTDKGYTTHTCSCGDSYVDTYVDALGHDTELKNAKSATCTEAGYTGDEVCKTCGTTVKAGSAIAALGHDYKDGVCTVCGAKDSGYVPPHVHAYSDKVTAPTCTDKGYTTHTCACGDSYKDSYVDALGHDYKDGVCTVCGEKDSGYQPPHTHSYTDKVTAPTCTEKGYTTHTCSCGDSYIDSYVDAVGHKTVIKGAYPATTTEQGYTGDEVCEVCGVTLKVGSLIPVISGTHTHDYIGVVTAPTCRDKGYTTHTCSCGDSYIDSYVDALGHDTKLVNVQSATCTSDGYTGDEVCTRCGVTVKVGSLIDALGHDYKDGACTRCGAKDPNGGGSSVEPTPAVSFTDVADSAYYAKPVAWAVANNITGGYSDNTFRPMNVCTRAQIVTFLWRANGSPEPQGTSQGFNDVFEGTYYYKAVLWAAEQGITGGFNDGGFHPDEFVTRAQAMTFLWRAEGKPAVPAGTVNTFTDVPDTAYYHDAVLWAVANNITGGYNNATFGSMDGCTRAQIVTFLYRDMAQ